MKKINLIFSIFSNNKFDKKSKPNLTINKSINYFFSFLFIIFFSYFFIAQITNSGVNVFSITYSGKLSDGHSVRDDSSYQLNQASSVVSAIVSGNTYIFVTGYDDDGISVFSVDRSDSLDYIMSVRDNATYELDGVSSSTTAEINGNWYLFVTGYFDNGISVFRVSDDGHLTHVTSVNDDDIYQLEGASSVTTTKLNGNTYLFVAGRLDDGVSVFSVANNGNLTHVMSVDDKGNFAYKLEGANSVATGLAYGEMYLFVAGSIEDGVTVFKVADDGKLAYATSIDDTFDGGNGTYKLDEAYSVVTAEVNGITYLFVAGRLDDGVTVFRVGKGGRLNNVYSVSDKANPRYELDEAYALTTLQISGITYLLVAGYFDDGITVFRVAVNGKLHYITSVDDKDGDFALDGASSIAVADVTGSPDVKYVFVTGFYENGVNAFYFQVQAK